MGSFDPLTMALLAAIGLTGAAIMFWLGYVKYETTVLLALLSPWTHWLFLDNNSTQETMAATTASYLRVGMVLLAGFIGYCTFLRLRRTTRERVPLHLKLMFVFILLGLASTLYSIDQEATLTRSVEFLAFFGFLLGLHIQTRSVESLERIVLLCGWVLIIGLALNIVTIPMVPSKAWNPSLPDRLEALTDNPNSLGGLCMLAYPMIIWMFPQMRRRGKAFLLAMFLAAFVVHVVSGSRSTMAVAALELLVWCVVMRQTGRAVLLAGVLVLAVAASSGMSISSFKRTEDAKSSAATLTGRTEYWKAAAILIRENPLMGYGFEVSGKVWNDPRFKNEEDALWSGSSRASLHNGYLDVIIGLGLPGLMLFMTFLLLPVLGSSAGRGNRLQAIILTIVVPVFAINFIETAISSSRAFPMVWFWIFWTLAGKMRSLRSFSVARAAPREADGPLPALTPSMAESHEH